MKQCSTCRRKLPLSDFHKDRTQKDGLRPQCRDCKNTASRRHYKKHWKRISRRNLLWARANADKIAEYSKKYLKNPENRKRNYALSAHKKAYRSGAVRCDCCSEEEILTLYLNRPEGMEVDHIVPRSKGGKHCVNNLQYLTPAENKQKGNK